MFLSRFLLNPARRGTRKLMASPQAMHAAVLSAFPPTVNPEVGRVLWRTDSVDHQTALLVLSPSTPDFTHLVEQAGWPTSLEPAWKTREYTVLDRLAAGQRWGFRLRGNPVRTPRDIGKPVPLVTVTQQRDWLLARCEAAGVSIPEIDGQFDVVVSKRETKVFRRGTSTVTLATAVFDGTLIVEDPAALQRAMVDGIGRGKAYGCGLLTLANPLQ